MCSCRGVTRSTAARGRRGLRVTGAPLLVDAVVGVFWPPMHQREVLAAEPSLVHAVLPHPFWGGRPQALHVAIESNRQAVFDLLLAAGADVDGANDAYDHWSPLMLAVQRKRPAMRDALLARGARVGLAEALLLGDDARLDDVLGEGPGALPATAPNGGSWLMFARTPHAIARLADAGASLDARDRWDTSPVEALSRLGPEGAPLVATLARRGAVVTPTEYARMGDVASLERLQADAAVDVRSDAVLLAAVDARQTATVRWLLGAGASANARATRGSRHTALHAAAWSGDLAIARLLVEAGADLTARDLEHDATPLGWAETSVVVTGDPAVPAVVAYLRGLA